jgi:DNA-binding transcriptional ArsR family regulator
VVRQVTAHYQLQFRDLAPQGQRVLEALALAPREMSPSELAEALAMDSTSVSKVATRMAEDGVLRVRREGRHAWYAPTEPLFRYWLEYRNAEWEATRVGWAGRLIEAVLTPQELARRWIDEGEPFARAAMEEVLRRNPTHASEAWKEILARAARVLSDPAEMRGLLDKAIRLPPGGLVAALLAEWARLPDPSLREGARRLIDRDPDLAILGAAWSFEELCLGRQVSKKDFLRLVRFAADCIARRAPSVGVAAFAPSVVDRALEALQKREPRGAPWTLRPAERKALARVPGLRATFLTRGKFPTHTPLLEPGDVLAAGLEHLWVDNGALLVAAMHLRHGALFEAAVESQARGGAPAWLAPNPTPELPAPAAADQLTRLCGLHLRGPGAPPTTWAATWADASPEVFDALLSAVPDVAFAPPDRSVEVALVSLGRRAPDRLAAVRAQLPPGPLHDLAVRAEDLAAQLREGEVARLHAELHALDELIRLPRQGVGR